MCASVCVGIYFEERTNIDEGMLRAVVCFVMCDVRVVCVCACTRVCVAGAGQVGRHRAVDFAMIGLRQHI